MEIEIVRLQEQLKNIQINQATCAANTEKLFDKLFADMEELKESMNRGRGIFAASLTFAGIIGAAGTAALEWFSRK